MTVLNLHTDRVPPDAVDIMRPNRLGNPFVIGRDGDRDEVVRRYRGWLWGQIGAGKVTVDELAAMDGLDLVCCCKPRACHGDEVEKAVRWAVQQAGARG